MRNVIRLLLVVVMSAFLTSAAYVGGYGTAFVLHPTPQESGPANFQDEFRLFWEAWRIVQDEHYSAPVDESVLTYGSIRGAVDSLGDPYSWFANPDEAGRIREAASGR